MGHGSDLKSLRVVHTTPRVLQDVGVLGDTVVNALNGVRHPAITSGIHELTGDDADSLVHA